MKREISTGSNPKIQIPRSNHSQLPNPKAKSQVTKSQAGRFAFGIWPLGVVGAWDLVLGISPEAHRKNASGSPPSTGMTCPVVLALWSPARKRIALAQSAGRIGRRVMVRRA